MNVQYIEIIIDLNSFPLQIWPCGVIDKLFRASVVENCSNYNKALLLK